jgi:hypothetical protein
VWRWHQLLFDSLSKGRLSRISRRQGREFSDHPRITHHPVRKVSDLIFYCENLEDSNEARLREGTLNLNTHAWIFPRLSIALVDGNQHLSEVVFSVLVTFSLYTTSTHHSVKRSPKSTIGMSSVAYVTLCGARDRSCGQQAIGASITTMLQHILALDWHFWRKTILLWFAWLLTFLHSDYMTYTSHLLDLITLTILGERNKLWSSSLCSLLHYIILQYILKVNV